MVFTEGLLTWSDGAGRDIGSLLPPPPGAKTDTALLTRPTFLLGHRESGSGRFGEVWMESQVDRSALHLTPMALPTSALLPLLESALYHVAHHVMTSHGRFHVPAYLPPALLFALTGGPKHGHLSSPGLGPAVPCMLPCMPSFATLNWQVLPHQGLHTCCSLLEMLLPLPQTPSHPPGLSLEGELL